jgi:hypothetical protein
MKKLFPQHIALPYHSSPATGMRERILAGCFVARQSKATAGILPPRAAHPAKIRSSAAIRVSDLVHYSSMSRQLVGNIPAAFLAAPRTTSASEGWT